MAHEERTNYSRGYVVEYVNHDEKGCSSWMLVPAENLWPEGLRCALYILALAFVFLGIAIASDVFMCSIEVITSKKRTVIRWDEERKEKVERSVLLWNETVANLTLMALGSSAPEILLATCEMISDLDNREAKDALGTFTIIGSAAFNLLIITAVCILSVPTGEIKFIKEQGVFLVTSVWSIWAYVWMLLVVKYISPGQIDAWEAWVTIGYLPLFVGMAYVTDRGWMCTKRKIDLEDTAGEEDSANVVVRVVSHQHQAFTRSMPKELRVLEAEKAHRMSITSSGAGGFRHATVSALIGSNFHRMQERPYRMADMASKFRKIEDGIKNGIPADHNLLGKFTFTSDRFAVLDTGGFLEIDILLHRQLPSVSFVKANMEDGGASEDSHSGTMVLAPRAPPEEGNTDEPYMHGSFTVDYETREGSAKPGKDFIFQHGTLVFSDTEFMKMLRVPIVAGKQRGSEVDFYIILKNPTGGALLGDPSIARITIMDDKEPGEFLFDENIYYANMKTGQAAVRVVREQGFDGDVTIEYSTINGTAIGGPEIKHGVDYVKSHGQLKFLHGETDKTITVIVNKEAEGSKNFIIAIRNPSVEARVGIRSAVVVHLNKDELMERVEEVLEDDEEEIITWGGQFVQAMTVMAEKDEEGNEIPPRWNHYLMHFLTFFWKIICALIPPTSFLGAWPAFFVSLIFIGGMTAIVEQLGKLLGCVVGLKTSVAGITIIALGTSLPDTFASRTAAIQDEHADAAIGNITGSNSVNVFLGLGLPWVLKTMHALYYGYTFEVKTDNLTQSVLIFSIAGIICIATLFIRRKVVGGELGGKSLSGKLITSGFLFVLWLVYILLSSLKAYDKIDL